MSRVHLLCPLLTYLSPSRIGRAVSPLALGLSLTVAASAQANSTPTPADTPPSPRDIVGTWQGTLHIAAANRDLRIVNKISKDDKGQLKVADYSIDQGGQPLVSTSASFDDGVLKYSIEFIGGKYEGKMAADGKTITGTWTQGPGALPLNLERANADTAWTIPEPPKSMPADANPGFEVATVKPSTPGKPGKLFTYDGHHFRTINTNVNDLLAFGYGLHAKQIVGAPAWFSSDMFDVEGVPDVGGQPNHKQMQMMVQKLLTDRFKLTFHRDKQELSVYVIAVGGGGLKIKESTAGPNDPPGFMFRGLGDLMVRNMSMADFAAGMQSAVMDKPVVDQTGLSGRYDFTLKWTPDESQFSQFRGTGVSVPSPKDDPNAPPGLYTAIQEQVGLKMSPAKAPDEVFVIDHAEKPTAN